MAESQYKATIAGQAFQLADANLMGKTAGLADDRVLAEMLRVTPFDSTFVSKAVLPAGFDALGNATWGAAKSRSTVVPSGSADRSVRVYPFRAVIGSRTDQATSPIDCWRDVRSGIFSGGTVTLAYAVPPLAANAGSTRWDLVYAVVTIDATTTTLSRRVKSPTDGSVSVQNAGTPLVTTVTIAVQQGVSGAPAAMPVMPSDSGNVYNVPLALVRCVNGFSTIHQNDIRDMTSSGRYHTTANGLGPAAAGTMRMRPANGNNDGSNVNVDHTGTYATDSDYRWSDNVNTRPGLWLPPSMIGGECVLVELDYSTAGHPSHASGSIIDNSVDWRGRFFTTFACAGNGSAKFASDPTLGSNGPTPSVPVVGVTAKDWQMGQSMMDDSGFVSGGGVFLGNHTSLTTLASGSSVGVYVDLTDGTLRAFTSSPSNEPAAWVFLWVMASAQMPNFPPTGT